MVRAAEQGLRSLRRPEDIAMQRGKTVREVVGKSPVEEQVTAGEVSEADVSAAADATPAGE
jgi:hypothetical protein